MLVASPALASVHAGDELVVAVFDHPELSGPAVVDGSAHISVPLAGSVDVRGLEPDQIAARLGEMEGLFKLTIKGQPVFLCCEGCKKDAEADPDKTLAKVEELKAKKKAMNPSK